MESLSHSKTSPSWAASDPVVPSVVSHLLEPPDLFKLSSCRITLEATPVIHRDGFFPLSLFLQISWRRFTGNSSTSVFFLGSAFDSQRIISLHGKCYTVDFSLLALQKFERFGLFKSLRSCIGRACLTIPPSCPKVKPPSPPRLRHSSANWNGSPMINDRPPLPSKRYSFS
ncbi:unnamed protein product [Arabidopsis thaliana]|uniref:(thale cress) hypothetical protein n=1 Tax=Arabidopsis thaliana TaxID=3702 RepID=A0A7G2E973_ARATH|nr:unnamed protein product [Arabidopsis thaliana]